MKDLPRNAVNKILGEKGFNITRNLKYDGCQGRVASVFYTYFLKTSAATYTGTETTSEGISGNQ